MTSCLNKTCSCPNDQYYNSISEKCQNRLGENESCESNEMCFGQMLCHHAEKICLCEQDKFFSNSSLECKDKLSINQSCDNDWQCLNKSGLTCQDNKCICKNNLSWDFSSEECRFTYSKSCNSNNDCNSFENLICSDFHNRCHCPSNHSLRICDCPILQDKYWNGVSCVNRKPYNSFCNFTFECSKNNSLICLSNQCQCDFTKRYNTFNQKCEGSFPHGSIFFENQLFYFSSNKIQADQVKSECEKLNQINNSKWEAGVIINAATNNFLKEYLAFNGITDIFWLDSRDKKDDNNFNDDEWKENSKKLKIDYLICPYGKGRTTEPMHYKVNCFYDNITRKEDKHFFLCRLPFN